MLKGYYLTLKVGPVVPLPVPKVVLEALTGVEVRSRTEGPSLFQLTFTLHTGSLLHNIFPIAAG